jgi:hypothetical protein
MLSAFNDTGLVIAGIDAGPVRTFAQAAFSLSTKLVDKCVNYAWVF